MTATPRFLAEQGDVTGSRPNLVAVLAEVPRSARWLLPVIAASVQGTPQSAIEARIRALMLLRCAALERSPYWRVHCETAARQVGVTPEEITLIGTDEWELAPGFTERERAAVIWSDRVGRRLAKRDAKAYATLTDHFTPTEIVELTLVSSLAAFLTRFTNALRIPPEAPQTPSPVMPVSAASLERWAADMSGPERLAPPGEPGREG
jgi:alkylhydroperoxidase family enzyme